MTTMALPRPAPEFARRVATVVRVLLTDGWVLPGWPLAVMGSSFVINVLLFSALEGAVENPTTGGLASLYIVQLVVCIGYLQSYFSFVVGLNVSRRAYYSGVVLVALGQSLFYGVFLYVCATIERATGGWGVHLNFFAPLPMMRGAWLPAIAVYTVPLLVVSCVGFFLGSVSKRWGGNGVFTITVLAILVLGAAAALITFLHGWSAVGSWIVERSWLSITIGWSLIPAALAAAGAWLVLRRTVP